KGAELEANLAAKITSDLKSTAETIFQRSQGIQLLRDTMFSLCEALQNGVIEKEEYRQLIQSLIATANFIIPFEQCTGMARASQAQIEGKILNLLVHDCLESAILYSRPPIPATPAPIVFPSKTTRVESEDPPQPKECPANAPNTPLCNRTPKHAELNSVHRQRHTARRLPTVDRR